VYDVDCIKKYDECLNIPLIFVRRLQLALTTHLTFPRRLVCALRVAQRSLLISSQCPNHLNGQSVVIPRQSFCPSRLDHFHWFADHRNPLGSMVSSSIRALGSLAFFNHIPPTEQDAEFGNTSLIGTPLKLTVV